MTAYPAALRPILFCLLLWAVALASPLQAAERRVALVVGNSTYADRPLRNPVNDALLMQSKLKELGFEVAVLRNADRRSLLAGLRDFEAKARGAEVALFFYAGHGAQVGGNNFLIPLNAQINSESDVPDEAVDAASVLRRIEDARAKVGLVILDACRDNPYTGATRSGSRGLARMSVPTGTIVAYATAPGATADDGAGRNNGVYTEQLARYLGQPGLDLRDVFDQTAQAVEKITNGKQRPREEVGLRGRFVLNAQAGVQVASLLPEPVANLVLPGQASGTRLEDLEKEEAARKAWAQWQTRMKTDFDKTAAFDGSADLKSKAWERFLAAWAQDNPHGQQDEELRAQAKSRLSALQTGKSSPQTSTDSSSFEQTKIAATKGDANAQARLAYMYSNAQGVPKDEREAVVWYRKAADQGYATAQYNLGVMYDYGRGVPKDEREAVAWYRKAADQGYVTAQFALGVSYANGQGVTKDDGEAVAWYRKAADQGNANAQFNLGFMHDNGRGVPKDEREAVVWYRKAADQGYATAQFALGVSYANGQGVTKDDGEAVAWYRKAADRGYATAQYTLGVRYANGRGVPKDEREAMAWYRKAADNGHAGAAQLLK